MPSWNRLRSDRAAEKELKRRAQAEAEAESKEREKGPENGGAQNEFERVEELPQRARDDSITSSPRRNRRMRDSVVSLSAVGDSPIHVNRPVLPVREVPETGDAPLSRPQRFSLLKFRHASDSQISRTAKEHADAAAVPPLPTIPPPSIITTAPTMDNMELQKRKSAFLLPRKQKNLPKKRSNLSLHSKSNLSLHSNANTDMRETPTPSPSQRVTFDEPTKNHKPPAVPGAPPSYGDESSSALALPISRMSESSRSDGSDHGVFASTTTTTHTVSTTTTFFRLSRRKKDKGPLFPLPPKVNSANPSTANTPRISQGRDSESPNRPFFNVPSERSSIRGGPTQSGQQSPSRGTPKAVSGPLRSDSRASIHSHTSSVFGRPSLAEQRGRSSTMSSLRRAMDDEQLPAPPVPHSTRTSTSTSGRPSFGGLFGLNRFKHGSDAALHRGLGASNPGTPGSLDSKQNSFNLPREPAVVIPERQEGDTPAKYLARLEEVVNRGALVTLLSKSDDEFTKNVMRSFMRRFKFFEDPLDMAVRKLLMHVELPKETQQIDRTLQAFADRYHECNPGIFASPDDAHFVAFSILILHTDFFNKNNKHKMQKADYIKNTRSAGAVAPEILDCFYDNISYTPFIHVEDDVEVTTERIVAQKLSRKSGLKPSSSSGRSHKGPVDPYTLILDNQLDTLRPPLDEILNLEDGFHYLAPGSSINISELNRTFFKSGVLQIVSARSRPEAFANQATISNPLEAQVGLVDMKITKVGLLWRKDQKKKKARSPWQEWGAILTGSQLYFFRNTSWTKNLMHQYDHHLRTGRHNTPVIFKPPIDQLKPDFLVSMEDAVALVDSKYKKHKNAFLFARQNIYSEVFLADNDADMKDWIAKLNYGATFRTAGVRMRGIVGGNHYEPSKAPDARRSGSITSETSGNVSIVSPPLFRTKTEEKLAKDIMVARRQIMSQKIIEADEKLGQGKQQLEALLRTARHVKVLTPIQTKTRDEVVDAAGRLANNIRWSQIAYWRIQCHRDILALDLEEDVKLHTGDGRASIEKEKDKDESSPQGTKDSNQGRLGFGRLGGKNNSSIAPSGSKHRPGSQPTGSKIFSMDDIFRTPSRLKPGHYRPKGSWELPPLNFDRRQSQSASRSGKQAEAKSPETTTMVQNDNQDYKSPVTEEPEQIGDAEAEHVETKRLSTNDKPCDSGAPAAVPAASVTIEKDEHELLVEAGVLSPAPSPKGQSGKGKETSVRDSLKLPSEGAAAAEESETDGDTLKTTELSDKETLSKVRHSFQRKLQAGHGHHHHRGSSSKKSNRTSLNSTHASTVTGNASGAEDGDAGTMSNDAANDGGLTRASGSFTVHGKKASVITFGDDWAKIPPEERIKLHQHISRDRDASGMSSEGESEPAVAAGLGLADVDSGPSATLSESSNGTAAMPRSPIVGKAGKAAMLAARGDADRDAKAEAESVHGILPTAADGDDEMTETEGTETEGAESEEDEEEEEEEEEDGQGYMTAEEGAMSPTIGVVAH